MRKTILFYTIAFALLAIIVFYFNRAYRQLSIYSDLKSRTITIFNSYQSLSNKLKTAAISNPQLESTTNFPNAKRVFIVDSTEIFDQLQILKKTVQDSINIKAAKKLDLLIHAELNWIMHSNIPDSILTNNASGHILGYVEIDSIIQAGILRTNFLVDDGQNKVQESITSVRTWMFAFLITSLLIVTLGMFDLFRQQRARKGKETELERSLKEVAYYQYALDEAAIVAITDQKGIIRHVNDNFCKISKYSVTELIGQDHRIINSGYHPKEFIRKLWVTIANGKIWKGELKNKAKDGSYYWVDTTIVPLLNEEGKPSQYLAIRADITERKRAEEEIIQLNAELEEKVLRRTQELQAANAEMEAFTYSVSHDLRAPLRGIIGFTSILEEDYNSKIDEEGKRITSVIKQNTLKMGQLIDDLLHFSRMGKKEIVKTDINSNQIVKEIITDIDQHSNSATVWKVSPLPLVKGDINMIRQVWVNLISNAYKYSSKSNKPKIEIDSFKENGEICFRIRDNGVGFDEQFGHKLFKVFQRLHDVEEFEGTGVGLALVEKIVTRHGGRVWAEGKEDNGASFYFSLPV